MNELFQIQPQWARARCLKSNPLAIGVEMPDRPMRAERPFTPLLLLLAIVYLMAVLTPTSAGAAGLDSAEALAAWAKSKNWTKTSYGIGYESDKVGSFDIWLVYDRTQTLIPFNRSYKSAGREPRSVTDIGENITIAGGIPATRQYLLNVHEPSGHESEKWEYYCHDYRVLMRAHRDTQIGQAGSDPLALLENYIAFVNKYLNVKPLSIGKTGKEDLHEIKITWGPQGSANPAFPGQQIECIVAAQDSLGHDLKYKWTALGAAVGFNDPTLKRPTWTVKPNNTNGMVYWPIAVEVSCDHGATAKGQYVQQVQPSGGEDKAKALIMERFNKLPHGYFEGHKLFGVIPPGAANNLVQAFFDWGKYAPIFWPSFDAMEAEASKFEQFTCGSCQGKVLEMLDNMRLHGTAAEKEVFNYWDYGPIMTLGTRHQVVVIYPKGSSWQLEGIVLDPWPNQRPEAMPLAKWMEKGTLYMVPMPSSYWNGQYPLTGGKGYPTKDIPKPTPKQMCTANLMSPEQRKHLNSLKDDKVKRLEYLDQVGAEMEKANPNVFKSIATGTKSPVQMLITDSAGRRSGWVDATTFVNEIPGAELTEYDEPDNTKGMLALLPLATYQVKITGRQAGKFSLFRAMPEQFTTAALAHTSEINITPGDTFTYTLSPDQPMTKLIKPEAAVIPFVDMVPGPGIGNGAGLQQLHPVADAYVYEYAYRNWNKANLGKHGSLGAGWHPTGGEKRTYLKFDLSGIDPNIVKKATLKLYHNHTGGKNSLSVGVHAVNSRWQEGGGTYHSGQTEKPAAPGEVSWVQQPTFDFSPVASFKPGSEIGKYIEVDITPLVKAWLSGKPNYGLMIKPVGIMSGRASESSYGFYSREYKDSQKRPQLFLNTTNEPIDPNDTPPVGGGSGTARLLTASSNRDMVGRNEKFRGNGKTDAIFQAQFSAPNRTVTAVEVSNTDGLRSVWDTRPNNRLWLGGVVIGGRAMNRPDGSVNFSLGYGQNTLDFFVEDNGSIRGGKTNYRMTIFFASGDPLIMDITPAGTQHPLGDISKTTNTGSGAGGTKEQQPVSLAGNWVGNGNNVSISQNVQNVKATALENKGPVGWKIVVGEVKGNTVYMNFNGQNLTGNISSQGNTISWSNNATWTRVLSGSGSVGQSSEPGGGTPGGGANLVTNGSFEQGKPAGSSYVTINPGSTDLPGWQITGKNVDVVGSAWNSSHGPRAVDIHGTGPGGIRQSFATTPGKIYSVSFDLAGNPWAGPQVKTVHVDISGIVQKTYQFDIKGKSPRNMGWTRHSFTFRATQTRSTLHIYSNHPPGNGAGPAVDNVVVIAATGGGQTGLDRVGGRWSSTFGVIHFPNSSGGDLRASYTSGGGRIIGKLNGRRLTGIWVQNSSGRRCNTARDGSYHWGRMEFTFNQKLNEFNGVWGYCEDRPAAAWAGKKK